MSITDELRECIATAIWQYENDTKTAYIPKDTLTAIADRIDERHRRDMATAQQVGYNDGEDAAMRDGWVKLPVDADGVPIRVGDTVTCCDCDTDMVERLMLTHRGWEASFYCTEDEWLEPTDLRHVQPDSWERIIGDALSVGWPNGNWNEVASAEIHERLVERCRRLAGGAE